MNLDAPSAEAAAAEALHVTRSRVSDVVNRKVEKFTIDALEDLPPTVSFEKPKRDIKASPVEEVFLQARADDDFGVRQLDLVYSVNGGEEKTVSLYKGANSLKEVSAGHTVYLEEMGVKPGDFVSYYAKAIDTDTVKGPQSV